MHPYPDPEPGPASERTRGLADQHLRLTPQRRFGRVKGGRTDVAISLITPSLTREQLDPPSVSRLSQLHLTPAALTTGRHYRDQAG